MFYQKAGEKMGRLVLLTAVDSDIECEEETDVEVGETSTVDPDFVMSLEDEDLFLPSTSK